MSHPAIKNGSDQGRYVGHDRYAGVRALWIKVIIRAVFDWVSYRESPKLLQRKLAESAHFWLFRPNESFNSFENICYYLDMNPENIRRWAKVLDPDKVAKIELLDRMAPPPVVAKARRHAYYGYVSHNATT